MVALRSSLRTGMVSLACLLLLQAAGVRADDAPPQPKPAATPGPAQPGSGGNRAASTPASPSTAEQHRLPPDATTRQTVELPGRTLAFTATAGAIRLFDDKGEPQADIAYTAYQLDDTDHGKRPVTFLFNGGPGASSAYLQLGNAGPWRLPIDAASVTPSSAPELQPNAETWLDFTDLVFIDPVGTGYSRFVATGDDVRKRFFSVDGDVNALALVIRRWLEKNDRLTSPKYVAGESYAGIRGPKLVHNLQMEQGIGVKALILLSPLMDFRDYSGSSLMQYVASLPSYAAIARQAKAPVTRTDLADVERYAGSDFIVDLVKGEADAAASNRVADKVSELTGIDQAISRRLSGRFDIGEFRREFARRDGKVTGRYDGSVLALDPFPDSSYSRVGDQSGDALTGPLTSAAIDLTTRKLNWRPDGSYELLSGAVSRSWDFGRGINPPESITELRRILALDQKLKVLVGHGMFDLATPYFGSQIVLNQLPAFANARVKLVVYPGGHMFYSRDASRQAFRGEVEALMK
jgi:carboxypeptidase C (cathepsin A)